MIRLVSMYPSKRKPNGTQSRLDVVEKRQTLIGADIRNAIVPVFSNRLFYDQAVKQRSVESRQVLVI